MPVIPCNLPPRTFVTNFCPGDDGGNGTVEFTVQDRCTGAVLNVYCVPAGTDCCGEAVSGSGSGAPPCCAGYGDPGSTVQVVLAFAADGSQENCPCVLGSYTLPWVGHSRGYLLRVDGVCRGQGQLGVDGGNLLIGVQCEGGTVTMFVDGDGEPLIRASGHVHCDPFTMSGIVVASGASSDLTPQIGTSYDTVLCPAMNYRVTVTGSF